MGRWFFTLEGVAPGVKYSEVIKDSGTDWPKQKDLKEITFEVNTTLDTRKEVASRIIKVRQGQSNFRKQLLDVYGGKCCVTEYDAESALEAAHILPYRGQHTHNVANGLLLRADVHNLFDLGLMSIHPSGKRILIKEALRATKYCGFENKKIGLPSTDSECPSEEALFYHANWAGLL